MDHKQIILLLWYLTGIKAFSSQRRENNVCNSFEDFQDIQYSNNCWYNPDVYASPETIVRNHGYQLQSHTLQTEDGYNLTIFRIQDRFSDSQKQPLLLLHGLFGSAVYFMSSGNMSLAFYLARNGYDVWLANHRGTSFSEGHAELKMTDKHFWDFSFHEIALYDMPSVVEYISETTGNFTKLIYVGHSMGTTIGFIYASLKKNHAEEYMKGYIALCPVTAMRHSAFQTGGPAVDMILQGVLTHGIFVLFSDTRQVSKQVTSYCMEHVEFCLTILALAQGEDQDEYIPEYLVVALSHYPERTSLKCVAHYFQMITSGRFQQYDYGVLENVRRYNSEVPPLYSLSEISIPVHLFYGLNDRLAAYEDVLWTFNELKTVKKSMTLVPGNSTVRYNHFDFLFSKNIESYFYESLMPVLKQLEKIHD